MYCLDRAERPDIEWEEAQSRVVPEWGGSLQYYQQDVQDTGTLRRLVDRIARENGRIDGCIAAAGIQQVTPSIEYSTEDVNKMLEINYTGVFMTATAVARKMLEYKCHGSICLIASMSGYIANKGLISPVYN